MTLAHIAGVPFEEWLAPLALTGTGVAYGYTWARRRMAAAMSSRSGSQARSSSGA
jgi:hypothetical protein